MTDKKWGDYIEIDNHTFKAWNKEQKINWKLLEVEYKIYIDGVLAMYSMVGGGFVPERSLMSNEIAIAINNVVLKEFDSRGTILEGQQDRKTKRTGKVSIKTILQGKRGSKK